MTGGAESLLRTASCTQWSYNFGLQDVNESRCVFIYFGTERVSAYVKLHWGLYYIADLNANGALAKNCSSFLGIALRLGQQAPIWESHKVVLCEQ